MFELVIKGKTPQELNENITNFVMDRIDSIESFKEQTVVNKVLEQVAVPTPFVPTIAESAHMASFGALHPVSAEITYQAPPAANNNERDVRGIPYDARIHSAEPTKNKDGTWKNKRGVDKTLLAQIENELKNQVSSQVAASIPAVPGVPQQAIPNMYQQHHVNPVAQGLNPFTAQIPAAATPSQPSYDNVQVPQGTRPAHSYETFKKQFPMVIAGLITEGKLTQPYVQELKNYFQVAELWEVMGSEAKCLEIYNSFCAAGLITKVG